VLLSGEGVGGMSVDSARLIKLLVVAVAIECGIALSARSVGAWEIAAGRGRPVDYLATAGLVWVIVLALTARVVARRVRELGERVLVQDEHLARVEAPRQRLAAIVHRTERVLADPESLQVALQPIIDLATGKWVAVEALARLPDNNPSDDWFADAHEAGVGIQLERLAFQRSVSVLAQLPPDVSLSINASPALILDASFPELMAACGPDRSRLTVEITEHAAVTRYEDIRAALLPHRERGLKLAVDDTGAGYASFAHVLRLRPDVIKLDRSLLADIDTDGARRAFVTAIVLMALELEAAVTAEGAENAAEIDTLRSLGVDTVQGYLLARPTTDPAAWAAWSTRDWLTHAGLTGPRGVPRPGGVLPPADVEAV
jgi:EAL domain-containing protein (putative c-di-GMP-specific phosphodiesterase class I)